MGHREGTKIGQPHPSGSEQQRSDRQRSRSEAPEPTGDALDDTYAGDDPATRRHAERDDLATTREAPAASRLTIMDAGEAVITEKGFMRATVEDIAQRAGITNDVFYGHFAGKGALLRALNERFCEQTIAVTDQATKSGIWENAAPKDVLEVAVRSILQVIFDRAGLVRAVLAHGATDPALAAGLRRIGTHITNRLVEVVSGTKSTAPRPDDRAIAFSLLLTVSLGHHEVLVGNAWAGMDFDREALCTEAARAVTAYLSSVPRPS